MKRLIRYSYPHFVWLTTTLLSPVVVMVCLAAKEGASFAAFKQLLAVALSMALFGTGLTVPLFYLFKLLYRALMYSPKHRWWKKALMGFICVAFVWLLVALANRLIPVNAVGKDMLVPVVYSVVAMAGAMGYRLPGFNRKADNIESKEQNLPLQKPVANG